MEEKAKRRHFAKEHRTTIAATFAALGSTYLGYPLENLKNRIQAAQPGVPIKFLPLTKYVFQKEGIKGFWSGVSGPMLSLTLIRVGTFNTYQAVKYKASAAIGNYTGQDEPLAHVNKSGTLPNLGTIACFGVAGAAAGLAMTPVSSPFDVIKIAKTLAKEMAKEAAVGRVNAMGATYEDKGNLKLARQLYRNCGLRGFYSGFKLLTMRDTIGTAIYFMSYESVKQILNTYAGTSASTSPLSITIAGGFCGVFSLAATYPMDRARTAFQKEYLTHGNQRHTPPVRMDYFSRASYNGLGVTALRSGITNALLFSILEYAKKKINALEDPVD